MRNHNNTIWRALDLTTSHHVAVKQISPVSYNAFVEEKILRTMKKTIGFPMYYGTVNTDNSCYLIMQLFLKDLDRVFHSHSRSFTVDLVMKLGLHMIDRIRKLHEHGYIHRDIKPAQFMLDTHSDILYLIDFNLSSKVPTAMSSTTDLHTSYVGNATFASINAHTTKHQSKRDDCEAVIHVLIYFLRGGNLPWQKLTYENDSDMWSKIKVSKLSTPVDELCRGLPAELAMCLNYCRSLKFGDHPDYDYIIGLISAAHGMQRSFNEFSKSNSEYHIKLSGDFLSGMKVLLSETIGALPERGIVQGLPEPKKKKRYPRILDRSILKKADEFVSQ